MFIDLLMMRRSGAQVANPTSFGVTIVNASTLRLSWTAGGGGLQTEVWRNGSLLTTVAAGTSSYNDNSVASGVEYTYQVRHKSGSSFSSFTVPITKSATPPAPVQNGTSVNEDDVTISWIAVAAATEYRVYRSTSSGSGYSLIGTTSSLTLADNNRPNGTYYYVVRAYNGSFESANSNEQSAVVTFAPPLSDPTGFSVTVAFSDRLVLTFTTGDATAQTEIYRGTAPNPTTLLKVLSASVESYNDDDVAEGTHYYYRIRHVKGSSLSGYVSGDATTTTASLSGVSLVLNGTGYDVQFTVNNPPVTTRIDKGAWSDTGGLLTASAETDIGASPNVVIRGYTFVAKGTPGSIAATGTLEYLRLRNGSGKLLDEVTAINVSFDAMDVA